MSRHYYSNARDTSDGQKKISIFWLKQRKIIREGWRNPENIYWYQDSKENKTGNINIIIDTQEGVTPSIEFDYRSRVQGEEWKEMKYSFNLIKAPCHFGGFRWYFQCGLSKNGVYCGRRVAILYCAGNYFGCRHCASLSYDSCNKSKKYRSGPFRILSRNWDADDYYRTLKRWSYKGRPTRKYRKYLKMCRISERDEWSLLKYIRSGKP